MIYALNEPIWSCKRGPKIPHEHTPVANIASLVHHNSETLTQLITLNWMFFVWLLIVASIHFTQLVFWI